MSQCGLNAEDLDEDVVLQFLDEHLPGCQCPAPVVHTRKDLRAALGHLLVVLRANAVIPARMLETTPVDEELRRCDVRMARVRGLAATTRRLWRRTVHRFLRLERPQTTSRAVFGRRIAPYDRPIGPDCVGKTIRQGYARAGLPYTRAHLLRHTMARRLLASGSSLKEVADVLRHRSLNTTLIYAKLDTRNLAAVALTWPGDAQ